MGIVRPTNSPVLDVDNFGTLRRRFGNAYHVLPNSDAFEMPRHRTRHKLVSVERTSIQGSGTMECVACAVNERAKSDKAGAVRVVWYCASLLLAIGALIVASPIVLSPSGAEAVY